MAKTTSPASPAAPAQSEPAAAPSPLRKLLQRLADAKTAAGKAGKPFRFGAGMNHIPDRFHLDHADGDVIAALRAIGENAGELLAELP